MRRLYLVAPFAVAMAVALQACRMVAQPLSRANGSSAQASVAAAGGASSVMAPAARNVGTGEVPLVAGVLLGVAPPTEALTLARVTRGGRVHTLAVLDDTGGTIDAVDLSAMLSEYPDSPMALVARHGAPTLTRAAAQGRGDPARRVRVAATELLAPIATESSHVAAGINYADHARETQSAPVPFLFPKRVWPTGPQGTVATAPGELLDYEVELCVTFDRDVASPADARAATAGFVVCNDVTERATLLRNIDTGNIALGRGFPDAKGRAGYLPTGPYVVVPADPATFVARLRLTTTVNGAQRQDAPASDMIWSVERLVDAALAFGGAARWSYGGQPVPIAPNGVLRRGTLVLTGTPAGVAFRPPSRGSIAGGTARYVGTLGFLRSGPRAFVIDDYIKRQAGNREYLRAGDTVVVAATFLGAQRTVITAAGTPAPAATSVSASPAPPRP